MLTVKAKIPQRADYSPILPLAVPDVNEVKAFAKHLHSLGKHWHGEIFGWQAEYTPERRKKPIGSKIKFTPADFWIGESGIWFYSLMWEHGKNKEPVEFLDDRGIVKPQQRNAARQPVAVDGCLRGHAPRPPAVTRSPVRQGK